MADYEYTELGIPLEDEDIKALAAVAQIFPGARATDVRNLATGERVVIPYYPRPEGCTGALKSYKGGKRRW